MSDRLASLLELLEKDKGDPFLIYAVALEYNSVKDFKTAAVYFGRLIQEFPDYTAGYMQFAMLKEKQNDIQGAINLYKKGIEVAKQNDDKKSADEMEEFLNELE